MSWDGIERRKDSHYCIHETDWGKLQSDIEYIKEKVCNHITEGEKQGGFRDRLIVCEQALSALRTSVWKIGITAGMIGALIGNVVPQTIMTLTKWITG